jgi:cation:H+ antiporter
MPVAIALPAFLLGTVVSLATSWVLVIRLERTGARIGLSEALLGVVAALAADAPEITSAVSAIADGQQRIGAGVVIGSNVFNLAALLGLGAVVASVIRLHRKVVLLGGAVAVSVGLVTLAAVVRAIPELLGCAIALAILAGYGFVIGAGPRALGTLPVPVAWLELAVAEEEVELEETIHPSRGGWQDLSSARWPW